MSELLRSTVLRSRHHLLLAFCLLTLAGFFVASHSRGDSAGGDGSTAPAPLTPASPPPHGTGAL